MTRTGAPFVTAPDRGRHTGVATWAANRDVVDNAASLLGSTAVTSVLGLVYWTVAAWLFTQEAVGYGSAAVSALTLFGTIGMFGWGTMLIGELPRRSGSRGGLVLAAVLASAAASLLLGVAFAVAAQLRSSTFGHPTGSLPTAALFSVGVALTGAALVLDQATIGLLRGGLQLWRNTCFSVLKLLCLFVASLALHDRYGVGIMTSWVAGTALSLVCMAWLLRRSGTRLRHLPDWAGLRGLGRTTVAHTWLNLAVQLPRLLVPVLVTALVSASANGAFYVVWMLVGVLYLVPTHLSTALFAATSSRPAAMARKLRFTMAVSSLLGLGGMAVIELAAPQVMAVFGDGYEQAGTGPLRLLGLGLIPTIVKVHYIAVCRAADRLTRAAVVLSAIAVLEIAGAVVGAAWSGLEGVCVALLACYVVEGLYTGPMVWRAAQFPGRG
jgi:O-antigen/teichoic acid export membrane protein